MNNQLWPISEEFLASLPLQLRQPLNGRKLEDCQFPWEVLAFLLENLNLFVEENHNIPVNVPSSATIIGNVVIEMGARIEPNTLIIGPAWIALGTTVHAFSRIHQAYLGVGVRTGSYTELNRCIVGELSRFHHVMFENSLFGLKVIAGLNAHGFNTVGKGNVRSLPFGGNEEIDTGLPHLGQIVGDNTFITGDSAFQPGVKVGREVTFLSSGINVYADIEDSAFVAIAPESRQKRKITKK